MTDQPSHSANGPSSAFHVVERPVTLEVERRRLKGTMSEAVPRVNMAPGLVFVHGLASKRTGYVRRAERVVRSLGISCLSLDLSGHGESDGDLSELTARDHLQDVLAAWDAVARHGSVAVDRIGICGASYGGFLAALATAGRPVARILLRAPALYEDDLLDVAVSERSGRRSEESPTTLVNVLRRFGGKVLVVESELDESVPHETIETYLRACKEPYHISIPGAGHELSDPKWREVFATCIVGWFSTM